MLAAGTVVFIAAILQAHPGVRGRSSSSLGQALPGARAHLAVDGLYDLCCDIVACHFFRLTCSRQGVAGGYSLAHVIHNWGYQQALAILRAVRAAIPHDGRLRRAQAIIPDDDSPHLAKDLDIRLITISPGGGRTNWEYARLLDAGGLPARTGTRPRTDRVRRPAGGPGQLGAVVSNAVDISVHQEQ